MTKLFIHPYPYTESHSNAGKESTLHRSVCSHAYVHPVDFLSFSIHLTTTCPPPKNWSFTQPFDCANNNNKTLRCAKEFFIRTLARNVVEYLLNFGLETSQAIQLHVLRLSSFVPLHFARPAAHICGTMCPFGIW